MAPPWSAASDEVMARPRPEPRWFLVNWLPTCSNGRPSLLERLARDADAGVGDGEGDGRRRRARTVT